jgi:hypothetical protein
MWAFLLNRWVVLIIGILIMLVGLKPDWTLSIVRSIGMMGWAENRMGRGGTFTVWKIIGILAPIAAVIYFFSGGIQFNNNTQNTDSGTSQNQSVNNPNYF